jgi:NhaP-type Na+/H+ and K+/H+ antiporter
MMGNTEKERFNVAYFSTLVVLMLQFGGVVWYASRMDSRIQNVEIHLERVDQKVSEEVQRTNPIIYESKYLKESFEELKHDVKGGFEEIKKDIKEVKSAIVKR